MKKTVTTTATVYVHAYEGTVVNAKELQEEIAARAADFQSDDDRFSEWLNCTENLSHSEVFHLTEEERAKLLQRYETYCFDEAAEELADDWNEHTIEVEVEIEV